MRKRLPILPLVALALVLGSAGAGRAALVGILEEPADGGECTGVRNIRGWVYSTSGSALEQPFSVLINGKKSIEVPCCASREDVRQNRKGAPARTGFSGVLNFGLLQPKNHEVSVVIESRNGESLTLKARCTSRRIGGESLLTDLDLDNDGEGYCETDLDDPRLICCEGIRTQGPTGPQICDNVCYRWNRGTQGLVMSAGPVLANPQCRAAP